MPDRLQQVFEYRILLGKRDRDVGPGLSAEDRERLADLSRVLATGIPMAGEANPATRLETPVDVSLSSGRQRVYGSLLNVSADGFGILLDPPPPLGERVTVNLSSPLTGTEYQFRGRIVARVVKGMTSVGIALHGEPTRVQLDRHQSGVWRHRDTVREVSPTSPLGKAQRG